MELRLVEFFWWGNSSICLIRRSKIKRELNQILKVKLLIVTERSYINNLK